MAGGEFGKPADGGANKAVPPPRAKADRLTTLDGMRGLAAIAVALFHLDPAVMPGGYLAVDFFFVLSGFVLLRTYEPRFRAGLGTRQFMLIRGLRLYPLFSIGIVIGAVFALQGLVRGSENHMPTIEFAGALAFNTLMLPSPFSHGLFPLNAPAWSLFFEMLANLALVTLLARLRTGTLAMIVAFAGLGLVFAIWHFAQTPGGLRLLAEGEAATSAGAYWDGWYVGIFRTAFSFCTGMAIARLSSGAERPARAWAAICFLTLLLLMVVAVPLDRRIAYDLTFILVLSPLLVIAGSRIEPYRVLVPAAALVGDLSYALYAVHLPLAHASQFAARKAGISNFAIAPVYIAGALALAWICVRWADLPLRRMLSRKFIAKPA